VKTVEQKYKYPNTIELASKPPYVRYLWVLVVERDLEEGDKAYSGMTWSGLVKALNRCGWEAEEFKMVDIEHGRVINLPSTSTVFNKILSIWRKNYFNPEWTLVVKKKKGGQQ